MRRRPRRAVPLLAAVVVGGCGSPEREPAPAQTDAATASPERLAPGLLLRIVTVRDDPAALASALVLLEDPSRDVRAAPDLRREGLRAYRVDGRLLEAIDRAVEPLTITTERRSMGEPTDWSIAARSSVLTEAPDFAGAGVAPLEPGRPALLVRSWLEPAARDGRPTVDLRVDLLPQWRGSNRPGVRSPLRPAGLESLRPVQQGLPLRSLAFETALADGESLVLVPERPEADWAAIIDSILAPPPEPADDLDEMEEAEDPDGPDQPAEDEASDEPPPPPPTLGTLLLGPDSGRGVRRILIFERSRPTPRDLSVAAGTPIDR